MSHLAMEWRGRVKKAAEDFLYCFYISGCAYHELPYSRLLYSLRNWNIDYTRALKLFGRLGALAKRGKCSPPLFQSHSKRRAGQRHSEARRGASQRNHPVSQLARANFASRERSPGHTWWPWAWNTTSAVLALTAAAGISGGEGFYI